MNELALFNSLFNNGLADDVFDFNYKNAMAPRVDVFQLPDAYKLEMELPGRTQDGVNIEINGGTLTIASKKEATNTTQQNGQNVAADAPKPKYLIRERHLTSFSRSFSLPDDVDESGVAASFKNGILTVTMKRRSAPEPRKIAIQNEE